MRKAKVSGQTQPPRASHRECVKANKQIQQSEIKVVERKGTFTRQLNLAPDINSRHSAPAHAKETHGITGAFTIPATPTLNLRRFNYVQHTAVGGAPPAVEGKRRQI
ncbi:hypothetical protein TRVL_02337 [Trypanosoma vivax]|uniref:Uncharacterized protein n=1 Tax=Trypanosoma vivax (strain Y486) TaxID=1055687 RepID=G0UCT7_TRYVY|nr:hypothetical protein TRVL_02337 [Trypanosoma vivax]CCC53647.1 hypothetical protein, unlikely [Trypanosoma vivax Y486]